MADLNVAVIDLLLPLLVVNLAVDIGMHEAVFVVAVFILEDEVLSLFDRFVEPYLEGVVYSIIL